MTLLLTRLDIHGFKSFATQTSFLFDRGITAIVGPNGSGKSNVAEALRWVLGEQGYANLRSRKTEDVIFSGSDRRAALGMAEVIVTFDNRDGDLPLAFDEVTVSRRAYRSGENQYLINGARVRLKDVQRLVAPLGQAYTIIGQGLVDAALSQRPEERRGLFEHAAGIGGLRLQATEAERGLHESAANAARLHDILGELEPRVRSLERSARLAREYGAVRESLRRLQQRHYARLWRESQERINAARLELKQADALLAAAEERQPSASSSLGIARGDERRLAEAARRRSADIADAERNLAEEEHRRDM
ncbi:MAG: chromosome segregation protein SMC, partial [Chloroflexi bacterium]